VKSGFSIYEALHFYSGQNGIRLSLQELETLSQWCADALREAQAQRVLVRLHARTTLKDLNGSLFVDPELAPNLPSSWRAVPLVKGDSLSGDHFLISNDERLPLILTARYQDGAYTTFVSVDESLIEAARAILAQYAREDYLSLHYQPQGLIRAGQLVVKLSRQYPIDLINSWTGSAVTRQGLDQLQALQQASGAYWLKWRNQTYGDLRRDGHMFQVTTPDSDDLLEALGDVHDQELVSRLHICFGILFESPAISTQVRSANLDLVFTGLQDQSSIQADAELDWPELEMFDHPPKALSPAATTAPAVYPPHDVKPLSSAEILPAAQQPTVSIPSASVDLLNYVNSEISRLRDHIMDLGAISGLPDKPRQRFSEFVHRSGDLLLLINEVLYIQRMAQQIEENSQQIEPHGLLNALIITYAGEADRRGVELSYEAPDTLPDVTGNAEAINRALVTMLEHAMERAQPRGQVEVGARILSGHVDFYIRDSSAPLTEGEIAELFTPGFLKGEAANSLGFSALKLIAEAHNGLLILARQANMNEVILRLPAITD